MPWYWQKPDFVDDDVLEISIQIVETKSYNNLHFEQLCQI